MKRRRFLAALPPILSLPWTSLTLATPVGPPRRFEKDARDLPELPESSAIHCPLVPEVDNGKITSVAFSPDGRVLAAGNINGAVKLISPATGKILPGFRALDPVQGACGALAYSPDGRSLAVPGRRLGQVAIVEAASGRPLRVMDVGDRSAKLVVKALTFSPDGRTLAVGSDEGDTTLWDAATGRQLGEIPPQIVPANRFDDERRVARPYPAPVRGLAFSLDGATLYVAAFELLAWDVAQGRRRSAPWPAGIRATKLALSPDGKTLAAFGKFPLPGGGFGRIAFIDTASGRLKPATAAGNDPNLVAAAAARCDPASGPMYQIEALAFLADGKTLVTLDEGRVVFLWDVATGRPIEARRFDDHFKLYSLAVSPATDLIAFGGQESNWRFGAIGMAETKGRTIGAWRPAP